MKLLLIFGSIFLLWVAVRLLSAVITSPQWEALIPLGQTVLFLLWCILVHRIIGTEDRRGF